MYDDKEEVREVDRTGQYIPIPDPSGSKEIEAQRSGEQRTGTPREAIVDSRDFWLFLVFPVVIVTSTRIVLEHFGIGWKTSFWIDITIITVLILGERLISAFYELTPLMQKRLCYFLASVLLFVVLRS